MVFVDLCSKGKAPVAAREAGQSIKPGAQAPGTKRDKG